MPAPAINGLLAIGEEIAGERRAGNNFNSLKSLNDPEKPDLSFAFCVKRGFSMKKLLIAAAVAVLATNAMAADFPRRAPGPAYADPVAARIFDWSGFYLGGNVGYGWASMAGVSTGGFLGGVHGGYNYMWANGFLLGAEADLSTANITGSAGPMNASLDYFGTIRGRIGFAVDRMLFYGTVGWAWGRGTIANGGLNDRQAHGGWTFGIGVEGAITQNLVARVEYLRLNLGAETYATIVGPVRTEIDTNILRVGMSYKF
jgi:outer membrane immunogenic protein